MSYEPTVWKSGDIVTSAKLNKLEQGVAGGGSGGGMLLLHEDENGALDKTYAEIVEAAQTSVVNVITMYEGKYFANYLFSYGFNQGANSFEIFLGDSIYVTESENGYPTLPSGEGEPDDS
jgi:hypothetical protein